MGSVQIGRVMCFNAHGPEGLINGKAPGLPSRLNNHQHENWLSNRISKSTRTSSLIAALAQARKPALAHHVHRPENERFLQYRQLLRRGPSAPSFTPDVCGRSLECKQNLHSVLNGGRVLTCVRPLVATLIRRGPIWEFADQVQNAHAHSGCRPAELVFLIPSLDRLSISFVRPAYTRNGG